ncbi:hypothetical protein [Methylobacterium sp. WL120]|uniref:hypothetical protein n=1 Tax=Methylobacterium sp. WL120 TaxID=2603887 RepID=UPI0011C8B02F|nr:hypothetical protein [Methylobacterium sp. WL120]TXM69648.1 hypothetical protein FV229_04705 [Methylobacterium sp. WL120]
MSVTVPHNISDLSITFFARGRPYEVQKSHRHFDAVRTLLLGWAAQERTTEDLDSLIALADPREQVRVASDGKLEFIGGQLVYAGQNLHNLWADKILAFRDAGEQYDPIFRALEDLQRNPTPSARDRLPIFVERSKLGFLPDGRIAAFKGVRENFNDVHSNTVNYAVGKTVAMPREACNANPDQTCVAGLHVGAIDYIKEMGYGWGADRRMLLVAFWPRHSVAVPTDYRGGKMRVEQLEVLDEVDRKYVDELLSSSTTIVRGYENSTNTYGASSTTPATTSSTEPFAQAKVGDWIYIENDSVLDDGTYLVMKVNHDTSDEFRLDVKTGPGEDEVDQPDNDAVVKIVDQVPAWFAAKVGDWVVIDSSDHPQLVTEIDERDVHPVDDSRLKVLSFDSEDWVSNSDVTELLTSPPPVWMRVQEEDMITIEGHSFLRDGVYKAIEFDTSEGDGEDDTIVTIEVHDDSFTIKNGVIKSIQREVDEAVAKGTAAAAASAPVVDTSQDYLKAVVGDTVTIKGSAAIPDGDHTVIWIDEGDSMRLKVDYNGGTWVRNERVLALVKTVAPADTRTPYEQAEVGDTVRVEGSSYFTAGEYVVKRLPAPGELTPGYGGAEKYGLKLEGGITLWVEKAAIKAIVRKAGDAAPVVSTEPAWKQAKVGDTIQLNGDRNQTAGEYVVDRVDAANGWDKRLRVVNPRGSVWVRNDNVAAISKAA